MKRRSLWIPILLLQLYMPLKTLEANSIPQVSITAPETNQLVEGKTYTIAWTANNVDSVSLAATGPFTSTIQYPRGNFTLPIASGLNPMGNVSWTVPFLDTLTFAIVITGYDREGNPVARSNAMYGFRPAILANRHKDGIYIYVAIENRQRLYVLRNDQVIRAYLTSSSRSREFFSANIHPNYPHDHYGVFHVRAKYPLWHSRMYDVDMPWAMQYLNGHFIHGTVPDQYVLLGGPASSGCNRLTADQAHDLYSISPIGTRVEIIVK